ncbi:LUD domain-containing protein [candidate division KSB1 bacterium]|nr:LUD domain-containing protein [candidate division KSB1 bacterium]
MNSSRDKILTAVREAIRIPSQLQEPPADLEKQFQKKRTLEKPADLKARFIQESEKVSAECTAIKTKELTSKISKVLENGGIGSLAVAGNVLQDQLTDLGKRQNLKLVNASGLDSTARREQMATVSAGLVLAQYGVADIGSLVVVFSESGSIMPWYLPETVIAVVRADFIVADLFELFDKVPAQKLKNAMLVTGPSRTADIEKILILGAHGPKRLIIFILED